MRHLILSGLLLCLAGSARATVVERLSREALAARADLVVQARVEAQWVVPERGPRGEIYTRTSLRVLRALKGRPGAVVTVQQLGGTLNGYTLKVDGDARFEVGKEVVAFLDAGETGDLTYVVGMAQGVFHVERSADGRTVTRRDLGGLAFNEVVAGAPARPEGVEDLAVLVRAVAGEEK